MSYKFLTDELGLDKSRLAFSVFAGDSSAERDEEAVNVWKSLGVPEAKIAYLDKKENWWEPTGSSGPCGPDTEMFYWVDDQNNAPEKFDPQDEGWVEIGNDVLMQYEKIGENKYIPAKQKNIDNGTGLERLLAVINGLDDDYQTDLFLPIIEKIEQLGDKKYSQETEQNVSKHSLETTDTDNNTTRSMRIIADHIRAATFIMADENGIAPSNVDQGYVVRKLIRRAIRHGKLIGINGTFCFKVAEVVIKIMKDVYPELQKNKDFVIEQMVQEEEKFGKTLEQGIKEWQKYFLGREKYNEEKIVTGKIVFQFYETYGFPLELSLEELDRNDYNYDKEKLVDEFNESFQKHQTLSRTAAAGKFKGGLAENSEMAIKYHTATHLLLAALRKVLGDYVLQKGSNINDQRLRFDFSHSEKMTDQQKQEVEKIINDAIEQDLPVIFQEMSLDEAKKLGATGVFENKYGDKVKIYTIGAADNPFSREICGGPHVDKTGALGKFKIKKEESSSAGVRRIKAVLE